MLRVILRVWLKRQLANKISTFSFPYLRSDIKKKEKKIVIQFPFEIESVCMVQALPRK